MITNLDSKLDELLKDFYNLTHMKISVFNKEGIEISYYPDKFTSFCGYIRSISKIDDKCKMCDKNAMENCIKTKNAFIYTCHANLTECIVPILINDEINGFIAIGQIRENDKFTFSCSDDKYDKFKAESYFNDLEIIKREKILSALHVAEACAGYEQLKRFVSLSQNSFKLKLEDYIENNINGNLEVYVLSKVLNVSRVELYRQCKDIYNKTPAELIKEKRLNKAKNLLLQTSLSITQIYGICGFSEYNYFSKQFKKRYDLSPRNYRIKNK